MSKQSNDTNTTTAEALSTNAEVTTILETLKRNFEAGYPSIERTHVDMQLSRNIEIMYNIFGYIILYGDQQIEVQDPKKITNPEIIVALSMVIDCGWIPLEHYLRFIWQSKEKSNGSTLLWEYCVGDDISSGDGVSDDSSDCEIE
jgi:hypothetical protein